MKTFKEFEQEQALQEFALTTPSKPGEMSLLGMLASFAAGGWGLPIYIAYKVIVAKREKDEMNCNRDPWPERCMLIKRIEAEKIDQKFMKDRIMREKLEGWQKKKVQFFQKRSLKKLSMLEKQLKKLDSKMHGMRGLRNYKG